MKHFARRTVALVLCILAVCALFPMPSEAYSDAYTTVACVKEKDKETGKTTYEYHRLKLPAKGNFYTSKDAQPKRAKIKASWENGCIYFMPQPEVGHGTLGVIDTDTPVTILAEQNGLYFFMTDDGRMGWNGKGFFTKPKKISGDADENLSGGSDLTVQNIKDISKFLSSHRYAGIYTWMYYSDRPVVVVKSGETAEFDVHSYYCKIKYKCKVTKGDVDVEWNRKFSGNSSTVEVTGKEPGLSTIKFTNSKNKGYFEVLVVTI